MTTLIRTNALTKTYGSHHALRDVSLEVQAGECVGLLGPNGAGKTTLLNLIEGLRAPSSGTVSLFGGDPREPARRVRLGTTPQATALPDALRVGEVIDLVAAHYPAPTPRDRLVEEFGLAPVLRRQCGALSGGQQRRVAVALAFAGDPALVLLDEPTTGLDVEARAELWEVVRARHAAGCAIVVTSHHLEEIEQLAERVVVIDDGAVRADDTLANVVRSVTRHRVSVTGVTATELQGLDPAALVTAEADVVTALVADSDALVRALVHSGAAFSGLTVRGASLEEAFLTITRRAA